MSKRFVVALALLASLASGCATPVYVDHPNLGKDYFLKHRVRTDGGSTVYSSNYWGAGNGYEPGDKFVVRQWSTVKATVEINGVVHEMRPLGEWLPNDIETFWDMHAVETRAELGLDDAGEPVLTEEEEEAQTAEKGDDWAKDIAGDDFRYGLMPRRIRSSVKNGIISIGMTKAQVYMTMGPPTEVNFGQSTAGMTLGGIMDCNRWQYKGNAFFAFFGVRNAVLFDGDTGRVTAVE